MSAAKPYRLGLVVGKFSPLHRGHELVINTARDCCERVLVLGYSQPEFAGCERERRAAWVSQRFPDVINIQLDEASVRQRCQARGIAYRAMPDNAEADLIQQTYLAWLLTGPIGLTPDAMLASEHYLVPCAALLSRELGAHVTPIGVDQARAQYPISATRLRQNIHAHSSWLAPEVYKDFVPRIVLLGGESSGKTTLAQALADRHDTCWVPEYGRERWVEQGGQLSLTDLIDIGRTQIAREDAEHLAAHRWLFCDTSPLTTLGYAGWMWNQQPPALVEMAQRPYHLAVLCSPDVAFVQDGTRQNEAFRQAQHAWYLAQLRAFGCPWITVTGDVAQRVEQVDQALSLWLQVSARSAASNAV